MMYREALISDIPQIQAVRNSVKENMLSNPALVTDADCVEFITVRGKGWVCIINDKVTGFAIADLEDNNIWALFVDPGFEGRGIGKTLHQLMMDWYFSRKKDYVWLGTAPGTRAAVFYEKQGWTAAGTVHTNEIKFEMTAMEWEAFKNKRPR